MGRTSMGSRPLRSREPMLGKSSRAPPRTKLGRTFSFLIGRNGHDGSANASPDPLLLAPDPMSWHIAHQTGHSLGSYEKRRRDLAFFSENGWVALSWQG